MKKIVFLLLTIIITFSFFSAVLAEETTITAKDLNVAEPTVLPTSPLYFLKELGRGVQLLITFNPTKKAELKLKIASEKLIEADKLSADKENLDNALSNYTNSLNDLKDYVATLKQDSESSNLFLKKVTIQTFNQQKFLDQITEKQTDSSQKVFETKEKALNSLTKTSLELGSLGKFKDALEEAFNNDKSGTTNVLEVLKRVESIVPEQAKKSIIEVQNKIIQKRLSDTSLSEDDKNKLNDYLSELQTKIEYKDLISEEYVQKLVADNQDIFNSLGNISEEDKAKLIEYGKSILNNDNIDYNGILNGLFSLNISSDAKKIVDDIQSQIANRYSEGGITCLDVVNPVCGKDNKDYGNICEAKKVGVDVAYKGKCGTCIMEGKVLTEGKTCCPEYKVCSKSGQNICQKSCETSNQDNEKVVCTALWDPVCGVNKKTYSNECFSKAAGVNIKYKGECQKETSEVANPASVFCTQQGYTLEMRSNDDGSQYGVCIFGEGKECDEWKFYNKECGTEYIK
ncbi:MAG TPA: DUF333 domain-containing protein [Candidatus Pacearchaeota archaeon]|nr:DUF333 domain-containing protein [Candidatus Pacearchaeota archaeon]HPR80139.1 DUF333 domain-containing protein [Candidatus Pacearchaeota archaeon]